MAVKSILPLQRYHRRHRSTCFVSLRNGGEDVTVTPHTGQKKAQSDLTRLLHTPQLCFKTFIASWHSVALPKTKSAKSCSVPIDTLLYALDLISTACASLQQHLNSPSLNTVILETRRNIGPYQPSSIPSKAPHIWSSMLIDPLSLPVVLYRPWTVHETH